MARAFDRALLELKSSTPCALRGRTLLKAQQASFFAAQLSAGDDLCRRESQLPSLGGEVRPALPGRDQVDVLWRRAEFLREHAQLATPVGEARPNGEHVIRSK
jgi:hypothetical protein